MANEANLSHISCMIMNGKMFPYPSVWRLIFIKTNLFTKRALHSLNTLIIAAHYAWIRYNARFITLCWRIEDGSVVYWCQNARGHMQTVNSQSRARRPSDWKYWSHGPRALWQQNETHENYSTTIEYVCNGYAIFTECYVYLDTNRWYPAKGALPAMLTHGR